MEGATTWAGNEQKPSRKERRVQSIGRSKEIAQELCASLVSENYLSTFFHVPETYERMNKLMASLVKVAAHLVEAVRHAPRYGFKGSHEKAREYLKNGSGFMLVHDAVHITVSWRLWRSLRPLYLLGSWAGLFPITILEESLALSEKYQEAETFIRIVKTMPELK